MDENPKGKMESQAKAEKSLLGGFQEWKDSYARKKKTQKKNIKLGAMTKRSTKGRGKGGDRKRGASGGKKRTVDFLDRHQMC